jgi:hypothetical protein
MLDRIARKCSKTPVPLDAKIASGLSPLASRGRSKRPGAVSLSASSERDPTWRGHLQILIAERDGATDERRSMAAGTPAVSQPGPFACQSPVPPTCFVGHAG